MKNHAIGDGNKRITCPDHYLVDGESDTTVLIWDPEDCDISIRATVLTVTPKDKNETDVAYWSAINKAREKGEVPKILKDKAIFSYRLPAKDQPGYFLHFNEVGIGNEYCFFSITVAADKEDSHGFNQVRADLDEMIESLVIRKADEQFNCSLRENEKEQIRQAVGLLLHGDITNESWHVLQGHYQRALEGADFKLASQIGMAFGEKLREEVPAFHWKVKIDEYGRSRSLDFGDAKIYIFPEAMIEKRIDRKEAIDFQHLASGTIDAVENLYRKYQDDSQAP